MEPIALGPNLVRRPYRGGSRIAELRGVSVAPDDRLPEDWIGSTTDVYGTDGIGQTVLPDGRRLRDAVGADPESFLGPEHAAVFGSDPGLLVKLIDAQQRLSVHAHPTRSFARLHLDCRYGKTEAWYVVGTAGHDPAVHLGFREGIDPAELEGIVTAGEGTRLLERLHRIPVAPGDTLLVPGGVPHAIGEGVFLVEVQEPSDLLVRLEWAGYVTGAMPNDLGLGFATALGAIDVSAWPAERLAAIRGADRPDAGTILPPAADAFFRLRPHAGTTVLPAGLGVVLVLEGSIALTHADGRLRLDRGAAALIPYAAGETTLSGDGAAVVARPPDPALVARTDPDFSRLPITPTIPSAVVQ